MPKRSSQTTPNPGYYSPDPMTPTFSPPGEYTEFQTLRPDTPGSMGRYSVVSSHLDKYDREGALTPQAQALLPSDEAGAGHRSSTYYFEKDAAAGIAGPEALHQYTGRRGQGYNPAANAATLEGGLPAKKRAGFIRRRPILFGLLVLLLLVAAGVGAGVGVSQSHKSNDKNLSSNSGSNNNAGSSTGSSSSSSNNNNQGSGTSTAPAPPKITPFPKYSWTDVNTKAFGVSLGSWLVLERWQLEDWMVQQGGANAWDEWSFTQNLGNNAASVLQQHQNTWVTEADMDTLQNSGINIVRIPIPFWAFIPTVSGEPYYNDMTVYQNQLDKMLQWCYDRGMYVMLDLHAMPGSQNGDQSSGHNTTNIQWFTQANQDRSDTFVKNVLSWATGSNLSSIINAIGVVNEPRILIDNGWNTINQTRFQTTQSFYERSYQACVQAGIPMTFHNGFAPGSVTDKMNTWRPFISGKNPNMLIYEDHPYPGWFSTPEPSADQIQTSVCEYGSAGNSLGIPILMGEFSAIQNVGSASYSKTYLQMQLATYGWSAGSIFWNFKANSSTTQVLALSDNLMQLYSYVDLLQAGTMPNPGKGGNVRNFYTNLPNPCGGFQTYGWANPAQ
ncbi:exo-beta-1,3-glucanase [Pseudozyma hubeiensis SY62]|uniref:glucan 1,3-beta-glucosidase n=1 Tax=Pseudozyma hubeiensis (strain SY62) TaxID=1305764 RepID=R9P8A2_PSEHS|nr:exo-beta-1,3-glucanase [Pseudozyma hubeiensis SY62]GAC94300.1 exo-beta-1,3-glucanase [Pseudozyma hubeiensis SY62]